MINITNEEKVRELIGCPCPTKIRDCEACFDRIKVLEMAKWKEQQMIEKACEWIFSNHIHYPNNRIKTEQIIKDFKRAMEE